MASTRIAADGASAHSETETLRVPIIGTAPLIMRSWECGAVALVGRKGGYVLAATATRAGSRRNGAEPKEKEKEVVEQVKLSTIDAETLLVPIVGTSPLVMHRFSEKAKRKMLDEMQGRKTPKEPKDPQAEYEAAFYRLLDGTPAFPVLAFKDATVGGARFYPKSITMTALKQFLFFRGEIGEDGRQYSRIDGDAVMREDVVRVGRGGTDLRYRPVFMDWRTELTVVYVKSMLTRDSVLSLIDAGGFGVGVGEWRPEKSGDFGTYRVDPDKRVEVLAV